MGYYHTSSTMSRAVRADRGYTSHKLTRKANTGRGELLKGWSVDEGHDDTGGIEAWTKRRTLQDTNGKTKDRPKKSQPLPWDSYIIHTGTKCNQIENIGEFQEASLPEKFRPKKLHLDLNFASNKEQNQPSNQGNGPTGGDTPRNAENNTVKIKLSLSKGLINGATNKTSLFSQTNRTETKLENKPDPNCKENEPLTVKGDASTKHGTRPPDDNDQKVDTEQIRLTISETDLTKENNPHSESDAMSQHSRSLNASPANQGNAGNVTGKIGSAPETVATQPIKLCYSHSQTNLMQKKKSQIANSGDDSLEQQNGLISKSEENLNHHNDDPSEKQQTYVLLTSSGLKGNYVSNMPRESKAQYKRQVTLILNKVSFDSSPAAPNSQAENENMDIDTADAASRVSSAQSKNSKTGLDVTNVGLKEITHNHILYDRGDVSDVLQNGLVKQLTSGDYLPIVEPGGQLSMRSQHHPNPQRMKQLTAINGIDTENTALTLYADNMLFPKNEVKMIKLTDSIHQFLGPPAFHPFQNRTPLQRARDNAQKKMFGLLQNSSELDPSRRHKRWASASSKMYPSTRMSAPSRVDFKNSEPNPKPDRVVTPGSSERIKSSKSRNSPVPKCSVSSVYQSLPYKTSLHNLYKLSQRRREHTQDQDPAIQALEKAREKLHSNVWKRNNTTALAQESTTISRL